jgi:hypothetical protein
MTIVDSRIYIYIVTNNVMSYLEAVFSLRRGKKQRGRHLGDLGGLTYSTLSPRF